MDSRYKLPRTLQFILCSSLIMLALSMPMQAQAFGSGAKGPDVYAAQGMLKSLGYYSGGIDGIYGRQMVSGVRAFQARYGLTVTGAIDAKTLQAILWAYGELKLPRSTGQQTPAVPSPPPSSPRYETGIGQDERQMLELVNAERAKAGLQPFILDSSLSQAAEAKSQDMIDQQYFAHESPTYGSPFEMMTRFGISYRSAGENIACNQTVAAAHEALMNSSGHRANILSAQYTHIGIGIVSGGQCGKMFTQMFISK